MPIRRPIARAAEPTSWTDPSAAVNLVRDVLRSPNIPLRLVLGRDAIDGVRDKLETYAGEVTEWELRSEQTALKRPGNDQNGGHATDGAGRL